MPDTQNSKNAFEVILRWQTKDLPIDRRILRAEELLAEGVRAKDDDVCIAAFVWLYGLLDEQALSPDRPETNWALHPLAKIVSMYWLLPDRDGGVCRCIKTKCAVVQHVADKYWHAGDSEVFHMAFDFILTVGWPPQQTPFQGWLNAGCGRTCSMDERKFVMDIIRAKFDTSDFNLSCLIAIARRTKAYLPNDVGTLLLHALARKSGGDLLTMILKYMDFWEQLGGSSLSLNSIDLLARTAKNYCPVLDAAAASLKGRLVGGTDETRIYGDLSFVYSFNPPNMITVNVMPPGERDPVENFTSAMMERIRLHVSDFHKNEGRGISVCASILNHEETNSFVRFFKAA